MWPFKKKEPKIRPASKVKYDGWFYHNNEWLFIPKGSRLVWGSSVAAYTKEMLDARLN